MVAVGTIAIDLIAHTGKLVAPLKRAQQGISALAGTASRVGGIMAGIAAPLTGMLTIGTGIAKVTKAIGELGDISDESKRLGIPAEKLTALQYAAKQAGVETETLGKSLQFLMKGGKSVDDLGRIANELDRLPDPVRKMQLALKYFGRGGSGMLNMLQGGAAGLKAMTDRAEALGMVMSQLDVDMVEAAGDSFADIGNVVTGVARKIAVELAPYIDWLSNKIVDIAIDGGGMGKMVSQAFDWIGSAIANVLDYVDMLVVGWKYAEVGALMLVGRTIAGFDVMVASVKSFASDLSNGLTLAFREARRVSSAWITDTIMGLALIARSATAIEFARTFADIEKGKIAAMTSTSSRGAELASEATEAMTAARNMMAGMDARVAELLGEIDRTLIATSSGERFKKSWDGIAEDFKRSVAAGIGKPGLGDAGTLGKKIDTSNAALLRGSQEAFKAINATSKQAIEQQQLNEQKKMNASLDEIKRGKGLLAAGL